MIGIKAMAIVYRPWILPATTFWITILGWALYLGFNVAFPTETVYGLGASIWSLSAINSIYKKKGRPSTNPLIVHVPSYDDVFRHNLTYMTPNEQIMFKILAHEFWPGPVTFVVRANLFKIRPQLRNGTPFVGLRVPNDPIALALLRVARVPIAAPSANRSACISPTAPDHVFQDYKGLGIFMPILGDDADKKKKVGIESTIIKIEEKNSIVHITILRAGAIGLKDITMAIDEMHIDVSYVVVAKVNSVNGETSVAPGQELLHYSPKNATTYRATTSTLSSSMHPIPPIPPMHPIPPMSILIATPKIGEEYGEKYQKCFTLPYNAKDCASVLYSIMRDADDYCKKEGIEVIVICTEGIDAEEGCGVMEAIKDKVFRASGGKELIHV
jgi:tRNA threonylcarbamoyl adenosine modification protein (Sua5/YciO/YrdC/YwlC family)